MSRNSLPPRLSARILRRLLFRDARLSGNGRVSCASCHDLGKGGGDDPLVPREFLPGFRVGAHNAQVEMCAEIENAGKRDAIDELNALLPMFELQVQTVDACLATATASAEGLSMTSESELK